jgi:hypothetical protein
MGNLLETILPGSLEVMYNALESLRPSFWQGDYNFLWIYVFAFIIVYKIYLSAYSKYYYSRVFSPARVERHSLGRRQVWEKKQGELDSVPKPVVEPEEVKKEVKHPVKVDHAANMRQAWEKKQQEMESGQGTGEESKESFIEPKIPSSQTLKQKQEKIEPAVQSAKNNEKIEEETKQKTIQKNHAANMRKVWEKRQKEIYGLENSDQEQVEEKKEEQVEEKKEESIEEKKEEPIEEKKEDKNTKNKNDENKKKEEEDKKKKEDDKKKKEERDKKKRDYFSGNSDGRTGYKPNIKDRYPQVYKKG